MADLHDDHRTRAPERDAPPVIVACALAELATAEEAAVALRARGHEVDVVGGVEEDTELLASAIRRHEREGLYVLCRSPSLPRQRIDKLRSVLRGHEVPFGRTLTLAIESGQPRALEERIVSVARRMITGRPESVRPPARPLPRPLVTRVMPEYEEVDTRVEARKGEQPVGSEEIARWADSLAGPLPTATEDDMHAGAPRGELSAGDSMEITQRNPKITDEVLAYAAEPPAYSGVETTEVAHASYRPPLATVPAPVIPLEPNSAPGIASFVDDPDADDLPREATAFPSGGRFASKRTLGLVLGAAAVLVLGSISVAKLSASGGDAKDAIAKVDDQKREETRASERDSSPGDDAPSEDEPVAAEPSGEPSDEKPDEEAVEPEVDLDVVDTPGAAKLGAHTGATAVLEDSPKVLAALKSRDVRAIDTLLVSVSVSKDSAFPDAVAYCSGHRVAELEGWRVPTIGELWTIGEAKIVKPGIYWSDTVGDAHGDKRMVLNTKRARIVPADGSWKGARAVCIRERS